MEDQFANGKDESSPLRYPWKHARFSRPCISIHPSISIHLHPSPSISIHLHLSMLMMRQQDLWISTSSTHLPPSRPFPKPFQLLPNLAAIAAHMSHRSLVVQLVHHAVQPRRCGKKSRENPLQDGGLRKWWYPKMDTLYMENPSEMDDDLGKTSTLGHLSRFVDGEIWGKRFITM